MPSLPNVSLYIRTTRRNGERTYERVRRTNPQTSGGVFCLHFYDKGKRRWQAVGTDLKEALKAQLQKQTELFAASGAAPAPPAPVEAPRLTEARENFLTYKRTTTKRDGTPLDKETVDAYEQLTTEFLRVCQREYPEQITGQDLRNYMAALRQRGLIHRTVCNLYTGVACFLKFCGVDHKSLLPYSERPVPDDGLPEAYGEAEVKKFFAALARERDWLAFELLLKTGLREREMTTLEWSDLNLGDNPTVTVQPRKPHLKFRTKTGKGRTIPLERNLALKLAAWREKNPPTRLVFGTSSDKEDSHFYRVCQDTAKAAGLNPERFWLHKWRDTFGTWTCRAGRVDLRTLQHWMGHSSITMTERYLAPGQGAYAQDGINQTFSIDLGAGLAQMPVKTATM